MRLPCRAAVRRISARRVGVADDAALGAKERFGPAAVLGIRKAGLVSPPNYYGAA